MERGIPASGATSTGPRPEVPWVKSEVRPLRRVLGVAVGQLWSCWALLEDGRVVDSGHALTEEYLPDCNTAQLAPEARYDRRLYGIGLSLAEMARRVGDVDMVVCDSRAPESARSGFSVGQYVGIVKSFCFMQGWPIVMAGYSDIGQLLLGDPAAPYEAIDAESNRRWPGLPEASYSLDDGTAHGPYSTGYAVALATLVWQKAAQGRA